MVGEQKLSVNGSSNTLLGRFLQLDGTELAEARRRIEARARQHERARRTRPRLASIGETAREDGRGLASAASLLAALRPAVATMVRQMLLVELPGPVRRLVNDLLAEQMRKLVPALPRLVEAAWRRPNHGGEKGGRRGN